MRNSKFDESITKNKKPLRFLVAGALSNITNYVFYLAALLLEGHIFVAATFGYLAGFIVSYVTNRLWVFKISVDSEYALSVKLQTFLFFALHVVSAILFGSLISIFEAFVGLGTSTSWFLSLVPIAILNYTFLECIVFRRKWKVAHQE